MGRSGVRISAYFFLQLCLGIFFIILGVWGITSYNSRSAEIMRYFGRNDLLNLIAAIVQLAAGILLAINLAVPVSEGLKQIFYIALFVVWALCIILALVVNNFLKPGFLAWLYEVAWRSIILVSIWITGRSDR
jgi:hypothetical protein